MTTGDPGPVLLEPFPIFKILFGQFGWICIFKFFKSPLAPLGGSPVVVTAGHLRQDEARQYCRADIRPGFDVATN